MVRRETLKRCVRTVLRYTTRCNGKEKTTKKTRTKESRERADWRKGHGGNGRAAGAEDSWRELYRFGEPAVGGDSEGINHEGGETDHLAKNQEKASEEATTEEVGRGQGLGHSRHGFSNTLDDEEAARMEKGQRRQGAISKKTVMQIENVGGLRKPQMWNFEREKIWKSRI